MKKFCYVLISLLITVELGARENPFEPTDTYEEKQIEYLKKLELEKQNEEKIQEQLRLQEQALLQREKELEDLEYQKQEELRKIEALKHQRAILENAKEVKFQEIEASTEVQKDNLTLLPFVELSSTDTILELNIDTKFKLINQDILIDKQKILYDFKGFTSFYTIKKMLESEAFKSITVGTHKKEGFFRVVIELNDSASFYEEDIDTQHGKIIITKTNS